MAWHVLIVGGGFGGLTAARRLERLLPAGSARITLVNDVNFMLFTPLLPGAAGGTLEPRHVVVPLREELERTDLRLGRVTHAEPENNVVHVKTNEGHEEVHRYDQLLVALGSVSRTLPVPGLAEHAIGFKTLSEGIRLRNRVVETLEQAETLDDAAERAKLLTYVFVGAGYAGVEGLAELQDFAADILELYPRCRMQGLRFILVEARERIMGEIPEDLAAFATSELRRRGIEVRVNTMLDRVEEDWAELSGGVRIPTRTVVWTAGVKPHPVVARLGLPLNRSGRIEVDEYCQVRGHANVWAIGDAAAVPDPARPGEASPPTSQHVLRQAKTVARNIAGALDGTGRRRKFTYKTKGVFVDLGRYEAVADTMGIKWRGFPAWYLARSYHMAMMPGTKRKARLLADWTVGLVFGRDSSELGQLGHPPQLEGQSSGGTGSRPEVEADSGRDAQTVS